jgi:hypothetical protein
MEWLVLKGFKRDLSKKLNMAASAMILSTDFLCFFCQQITAKPKKQNYRFEEEKKAAKNEETISHVYCSLSSVAVYCARAVRCSLKCVFIRLIFCFFFTSL